MFRKSIILISAVSAVILPLASSGVASACHPKGTITKSVQNVTAQGTSKDANSIQDAVGAKQNDVLRYTVTIKNSGDKSSKGDNDMINVVLTDTLPAGVSLVANSSQRTISEKIGTVAAGSSITKTYDVTVTSSTDKAVIKNKACFTADSKIAKNAVNGCDEANVVVSVPVVIVPTPVPNTPAPVTTAATTTSVQPVPARLPNTGVGTNIIMVGMITSLIGYIGSRLYVRKFNH